MSTFGSRGPLGASPATQPGAGGYPGPYGTGTVGAGEHGQEGTLGSMKERAQDWMSAATSGAESAWDSTRQEARELASSARERAEDFADSASRFMRRYPIASMAGIFAAGILLGAALRFAMEPRYGGGRWQI